MSIVRRRVRETDDRYSALGEPWRRRVGAQERLQLLEQSRLVGERKVLGVGLEEEVERIVDRQLGDEIDLDAQLVHLVGERQPRHVVAVRILLPVQEVLRRIDALRVRQNGSPAMRRRSQPYELRRQYDGPIVAVVSDVTQRDVDAHAIDL
jgi:hypothetical protein